jgi:hypothetical protein
MKQIKAREGSKRVRKHSKPVTPAQHLLDHPDTQESSRKIGYANRNAESVRYSETNSA